MVPAVARSGRLDATIQNELNAQINVVALTETSNLDAIGKARQGTVRPTAATILWQVLIQTVRQITHAIDVGPRKVVGQLACRRQVLVRLR